jgi:hypothetical protein
MPTRSPPTTLILVAVMTLACEVAPPEGADELEFVEGAAQTSTIDASDCVAATIVRCPGSNLVQRCTLNNVGEPGDAAVHYAPTQLSGSRWYSVACENGATISMYCQGPGAQSAESCTRAVQTSAHPFSVQTRPVTVSGAISTNATVGVWAVNGPVSFHSSGYAATYQASGHLRQVSARGLPVWCGPGQMSIDADGRVLSCTLRPADNFGSGALTVTQGGGTFVCPAGSRISFGPQGFVSRCEATIDFVPGQGGAVRLDAPSFNDGGYLMPNTARLVAQATLAVRRSGDVTCAQNSPVSFDADGYLRQCNLVAGTSKTFVAGSTDRRPVACRAGAFLVTATGFLSHCTLDVALATAFPAIGGAAQVPVTCKAGTRAVFHASSGLVTTCTPQAPVQLRLGDGPPVKEAPCAADAAVTLSAQGRLSTCTFGARFFTDGYALGGTRRVCAAGTVPTFVTDAGRDVVSSVAASPSAESIGINAANSLCKLAAGATCSSAEQCSSGMCSGVCR